MSYRMCLGDDDALLNEGVETFALWFDPTYQLHILTNNSFLFLSYLC